jgi:hypothetical protein
MIDPNTVILDGEQSDAIIAAQAAEIRRLRLTDEEREAVERYLSWLQWCEDNRQIGDVGRKDNATLRGLLERTK